MKIKTNNNQDKELNVHHGGYMYYCGTDLSNQIEEVTSIELTMMNIKTDNKGCRYIQKGGQKKLYIDNAKITDKNNMLVKDYFATQDKYEVTFTFKVKTSAPDKVFAECKALEDLTQNIHGLVPNKTTIKKI